MEGVPSVSVSGPASRRILTQVNLAGVDLNLLIALDALLTERSVTKAARRVGISQPGMSSALARIRRLLGDPILVREGNKLVPTPRGRSLTEPVRSILTTIDLTLNDRVEFDPATDTATLDVSCSDYTALLVIAPLIQRLTREAPGVSVQLQPRAPHPAEALRSGAVDLVIEPVAVMRSATLASKVLFHDRWLCCLWNGNERVGGPISLREFSELHHISYSMGAGRPLSLVDEHLDGLGITRQVELTVESFLLAPMLLQGTDMVTMVLERAVPFFCRTTDIRLLEPPMDIPAITEAMWWNPSRTNDPVLTWLRQIITEVAAGISGTPSS